MEPTQADPQSALPAPLPDELAAQLQRLDPERWLTVLLAPRDRRQDLVALYGFNLEIAKIREITREPLIGAMRLQWWRDVIDAIFTGGKVPHHGVARLLAAAIGRCSLPRAPFDALLDARELDLDPEGPADVAALERYAEATGGLLLELAVRVLGAADEATLAAARQVGTGWALLGIVRATPFLGARRQTLLPADLRAAHGVSLTALAEARAGAGIAQVVAPIADRAAQALAAARTRQNSVGRAVRSPLLLAGLADAHLADLARAGYDPFRLPEARRDAALRLGWRWLRGRF